jgi:four helix bundle protein
MAEGLAGLRIYALAEVIADEIWDEVITWKSFPQRTVGHQLVDASDSIGANVSEGYGRYHYRENRQFQFYARGSLEETRYWLRRARKRNLISENRYQQFMEKLDQLAPQLNAYIRTLERKANRRGTEA